MTITCVINQMPMSAAMVAPNGIANLNGDSIRENHA